MTQEEIIQAISDDKMMPFIQPEQLAVIVDFVIKNYRPSLPSNLDEAAFNYAELCKYEGADKLLCAEHFKAGAEWMAGQGETIFDTVDIDGQGQRWITDNLLQGDYDCGEEVILQIRKK